MKIRTKLLVFAILCAIFPICAAFLLTFNTIKNSITHAAEEHLIIDAEEQLETLQYKLSSSKEELVTLSKMSNMQFVLNGDLSGRLQKDIDIFASHSPLFTEILAADSSGHVVAGNLHEFIGTSLRGTWEFEAPRLGIHFDGRVVQSYRLQKPIATHSVPLFESGTESEKIIGALIGSINWEYMKRHLADRHVFGGEQNEQRQIILESVESKSILYATEGTHTPLELLAPNADTDHTRTVVHDGQEFMMVTIPSRTFEGFRNPEWRMHVLLSSDIAFAEVEQLKNYFIIAALVVLGLAMALGLFLARSIVVPVNSLAASAERIASGDYDHELDGSSNKDEIGQLTNSFNAMRVAVRDNRLELVAKSELAEQAARAKGEFLANMSHEVRTPINGVLGMTELLLNTPLEENQGRYAKTIFRSGQALLSVINDILDYSKIEAGKLELTVSSFDLRELVEDVVEMLAENASRKEVELILLMRPGSPVAFNGDSARLRQVLLNLLSNAIKFTTEGEVRLVVSFGDVNLNNMPVKFQVIDTGIGISEQSQKQIFDSFVQADGSTTRQFGGTGLGLAISSSLVELMGGEIVVESKLDQGSNFWFEIELEEIHRDIEAVWSNVNALAGKRILIVDDTPANREIMQSQVGYWGAEAVCVEGPISAMEQLSLAKKEENIFDIVILDMHMPVMNGIQLAAEIKQRELAPNTRLVLLSSACDNITIDSCRAYNISSLVAKPVRQVELFNVISASLSNLNSHQQQSKEVGDKIAGDDFQSHVMLVEDNPVNQDMMSEMLRILGHTSVVCENGQVALDAISDRQFDFILMDCQMPVLDGFMATQKIREMGVKSKRGEPIPIVALTANALQGDKQKCLAAGMDDYLSKPVSSHVLKTMLSKWCRTNAEIQTLSTTVSELGTSIENNVLDSKVFGELLEMCSHAPAGYFDKLVDKFAEGSQEDIDRIQKGIQTENATLIGSSAHRMKSSSLSLGGRSLSNLCQQLEKDAKNADLAEAENLLTAIRQEQRKMLETLRSQSSKAA